MVSPIHSVGASGFAESPVITDASLVLSSLSTTQWASLTSDVLPQAHALPRAHQYRRRSWWICEDTATDLILLIRFAVL